MLPFTFAKVKGFEVEKQVKPEKPEKKYEDMTPSEQIEVLERRIKNYTGFIQYWLGPDAMESTENNSFTKKQNKLNRLQDTGRAQLEGRLEGGGMMAAWNDRKVGIQNYDKFVGVGSPGWSSGSEIESMRKKLYGDLHMAPDPNSGLGFRMGFKMKRDEYKLTATNNLNLRAFNAMGTMGLLLDQVDKGNKFNHEGLNAYLTLNEYLDDKDIKTFIKKIVQDKTKFDSEETRAHYYNMFNDVYNRKEILDKKFRFKGQETKPQ